MVVDGGEFYSQVLVEARLVLFYIKCLYDAASVPSIFCIQYFDVLCCGPVSLIFSPIADNGAVCLVCSLNLHVSTLSLAVPTT